MDATTREFGLPLSTPLSTAAGTIEERAGLALRLESDGVSGVGEATPLAGWTEPLDECRTHLASAVERLNDDDPAGALSTVEDSPAARHAVSLALADLRAGEAGEPLYRYLGSVGRVERVPVNATIGDGDPGETVEAAREALSKGYTTIKLKGGNRPLVEDAVRVERVREAVGPGVGVRVDANGAWTSEQADDALIRFAAHDVAYVEQPLPAEDLSGHARLRRLSEDVGVALDETLAVSSFEAVRDAGAADVVVLKPMALGGVDRARRIARYARREGIEPVITTTVDGVIARTAATHLAASLPGIAACGLATGELLASDLARDPAPIDNGDAVVPQTDGLGTLGPWEGEK